MIDNTTDLLLAETPASGATNSAEQPLTTGRVEATQTTDTGQDNTGKPSAADRPPDADTGDGSNASLNKESSGEEGDKKLPEHVPYKDFQDEVHTKQALLRENEALRLGCRDVEEYQVLDVQAKNLVNPFTGNKFAGLKEYREAEKYIATEQEIDRKAKAETERARAQYIEQYGDEYGNKLADLEARAARTEAMLKAAQMDSARQSIENQISNLEAEYKDAGLRLDARLRAQIARSHPNVARDVIDGLRESIKPLVLTPEKRAEMKAAAVRDYQGEKASDKARAGSPQTTGGRAVSSQAPIDHKAVDRLRMSDLLGLTLP